MILYELLIFLALIPFLLRAGALARESVTYLWESRL